MPESKIQLLEKKLEALGSKPDKDAAGRKKVDLLNDLAFAYGNSDPKKTEDCAHQALVLAERLNYKKGVAGSYRVIGFSYLTRCDYDKATRNFLESLKICKEIADKDGIAASYNAIGLTYGRRSDYKQALEYLFKALEIKKKIGDKKAIALTFSNIGLMYWKRSDYDQALESVFKALKVFEKIGDKGGIALSHQHIGIIHDLQNDYEEALEYYRKALKVFEEIGEKQNLAHCYNNIGITYEKQGSYKQAIKCHLKALKIREEIGYKEGIAASHNNIGIIYEKQGIYAQALKCHRKALKIQEEIGDKLGTARSCNLSGRAHTKLKHYDSAFNYLKKGLQISQEIGVKDDEIKSYKNFVELYEAQQNFKQALHFHKKYADVEKEVYNVEKSKQIAEMKTKYETETKEREAEIYHLKNVKLRKEIRERKKVEKELAQHRDQLEELVTERTAELRSLAHEISLVEEKQRRKTATYLHDNISQALSLAIFKIRSLQESDPAKNVKKELAEIKDIVAQTNQLTRSLTFEISPPVLYELGLEPAVEWLASQFQRQHGIICSFKDDGSSKPLKEEARILLFQAVRELLTNVSKHARAQTVTVSTARDGNAIHILVEDDGTGFNPDSLGLKTTSNEGFGLFNIKERLRHLGGKLEVNSDKGQGTSVMLIAPLKRTPRKKNRKRR